MAGEIRSLCCVPTQKCSFQCLEMRVNYNSIFKKSIHIKHFHSMERLEWGLGKEIDSVMNGFVHTRITCASVRAMLLNFLQKPGRNPLVIPNYLTTGLPYPCLTVP